MSKPTASKLTQATRLRLIITGSRYWTLYEIQRECLSRFGCYDSETALSARWRELPESGKQKRRRQKCQAYEYRVMA
ncbi:hypothetical protein [Shewanella sp. Isolate11]|uniref:hypothetical protein n=1 Tax=Shewanella sp. Isolate11 TaxID=2908530 RepID=UPI001EFCCF7E|nr:hypothetical protein [Shewanella sp. Isolate11]MCG9697444.1 hypothetical protein [Shewanella sp. Isolate11]